MTDVIENVKRRLDIVDVVGHYVTLKRAGHNFKALCPFHSEKTPSFVVFPENQNWKCFGCEEGGDVLDFVQQIENWDFPTTLQEMARQAGVEMPQPPRLLRRNGNGNTVANSQEKAEKESAPPPAWREMAEAFVVYCQSLLFKVDNEGLDHLRRRGLTDDTIQAWGLGWHDKPRRRQASKWGLKDKPIYLARGVVIPWRVDGEEVRHIKTRLFEDWGDKTPKYIRVRGGKPTLYGLDHLTSKETVVICEGELDAVLLWQEAGDLVDVVAIGSKGSRPPLDALFRLVGASRWLIALDTDAEAEAYRWGKFSSRVQRARVPDGKDVTEFHQAGGDLRAWILDCIGDGVDPSASWKTTLSLPGDTPLGVPVGNWERGDGRIVATYTRQELVDAVGLAMEEKRAVIEARLEQYLTVLAEATGCDDAEAERLLSHWESLNAEYAHVMDRLQALEGAR